MYNWHMEFYWIHLIMTLIIIGFVCYTIHVELTKYIHIQQTYFASFQHNLQKLVNAILMTNIRDRFLTVFYFIWLYNVFSDDVRAVWINWDFSELLKKLWNRNKIVCTLEIAETKLFQLAIKSHYQNKNSGFSNTQSTDSMHVFRQNGEQLWKQYLNENDWNHMYHLIFNFDWIFSLFLLKKRMNIINFSLQKLTHLNEKINLDQINKKQYFLMNSAFVQFYS